ncbi:hypothetical protein ES708_04191 [subsurface metagenome]
MKDERRGCVLGAGSTCFRQACRYWDLPLQRCVYREMKEGERRQRHHDRFKDDQIEERIRITRNLSRRA